MPSPFDSLSGTHKSDVAPWDSYSQELTPEIKDPMLKAAVEEYQARPTHKHTSNQALEEEHRQRELSWSASREYQWLKMDDYKDEAARLIDLLHSSKLLLRLRKIGLKCFYVGAPTTQGLIGLYVQEPNSEDLKFATGVQYGMMPAYSVMRFDSHGIPTTEKYRGWWTVLIRLIIDGHVTEQAVITEFGQPRGPAGETTRKLLFNVRNRG